MKKRKSKLIFIVVLFLAIQSMVPTRAAAGLFELSAGFSFRRSNYDIQSFTWSRSWRGSLGYHFSQTSGFELAFQDYTERVKFANFKDITTNDRTYSVSWVQTILGRDSPFQPFVKAGMAQLNREAMGSFFDGSQPPTRVDSLTGILGAGFRLFLGKRIAIRNEATSYLTGGKIGTWKDNVSWTIGASFYF